jgi:hypothetical protein
MTGFLGGGKPRAMVAQGPVCLFALPQRGLRQEGGTEALSPGFPSIAARSVVLMAHCSAVSFTLTSLTSQPLCVQHSSLPKSPTLVAGDCSLPRLLGISASSPIPIPKRQPDLGGGVTIYPNSTILGGKTCIGANSTIGANVFLMHSVPPNSLVVYEERQLSVRDKTARTTPVDYDYSI